MKSIEDLIDTFENTGDNGNFFIGDYSNVEIAIYLKTQQEEIERLNSIINELEKWIINKKYEEGTYCIDCNQVLNKLQELKGESNEKN